MTTSKHSPGPTAAPDIAELTLSLQDALDIIPAGALVTNAEGELLAVNDELGRQFGYPPGSLLGRNVDTLVPLPFRAGHARLRAAAMGTDHLRQMGPGRSLSGQRRDGTAFPIEVGLRAVGARAPELMLAIVSDRTEAQHTRQLELRQEALGTELAHQQVVSREMGHRVKNLLAMVSALITLSTRDAETVAEMEQSLRGRIFALSAAIDLATKSPYAATARPTVSIAELLGVVLAPFTHSRAERQRVTVAGSDTMVGQHAAENLALVFHELTTNALKYGALQHLDGQLSVTWSRTESGIDFAWRERAQPRPSHGASNGGFGSKLMARLIEGEFGGTLTRRVTDQGIAVDFTIPAAALGLSR